MKKTIISGIFALLFLGSLLFAQPTRDILPVRPPIPPTPPGLIEARYYEGEAFVQYKNAGAKEDATISRDGRVIKGTAYLWVERDVFKNLFRGRYAICYNEMQGGICTATTYTSWMEGRVHNGVWVIRQGGSIARLGPKQGFVRLDDGRMTITMNLNLKQPVIAPEPILPIEVAPTAK